MTPYFSNVLKCLPLVLLAYGPSGHASQPGTNNMAGDWISLTLSGNLGDLSPSLQGFRWLVMDQNRQRDDSPQGFRTSENLLFSQIGYDITPNASVWLGYVHNWIHPLDKPSVQESRPYQDFLWASSFSDWGGLKFTSRTRLEQRVNQTSGDTGVRLRQMLQLNYPLRFIHKDLGVYVGDEVLGYLNQNTFGKTGFSENRAMGGFTFQFTKQLGADLGYLGQYVVNKSGANLFTHNVQFNLRYQF
jgi:hypothetical protein